MEEQVPSSKNQTDKTINTINQVNEVNEDKKSMEETQEIIMLAPVLLEKIEQMNFKFDSFREKLENQVATLELEMSSKHS